MCEKMGKSKEPKKYIKRKREIHKKVHKILGNRESNGKKRRIAIQTQSSVFYTRLNPNDAEERIEGWL